MSGESQDTIVNGAIFRVIRRRLLLMGFDSDAVERIWSASVSRLNNSRDEVPLTVETFRESIVEAEMMGFERGGVSNNSIEELLSASKRILWVHENSATLSSMDMEIAIQALRLAVFKISMRLGA